MNLVPSTNEYIAEEPAQLLDLGSHARVLGNYSQRFGDIGASSFTLVRQRSDTNTLHAWHDCTFWKSSGEQRAGQRPTNRPHYRTGYDHVILFIRSRAIRSRGKRNFPEAGRDRVARYRGSIDRIYTEEQEPRINQRANRARTGRYV